MPSVRPPRRPPRRARRRRLAPRRSRRRLLDHAGKGGAAPGRSQAHPRRARRSARAKSKPTGHKRPNRRRIGPSAAGRRAVSEEKATISVAQGTYEPCEECGAPLDPAAALLRQLRRPARQRRQPGLALLRGDEQKGAAAAEPAAGEGRARQSRRRGRVLRAAADRGRARRRRRPQRLRRRRQRGAAAGAAPTGSGRGQHRRGRHHDRERRRQRSQKSAKPAKRRRRMAAR